MSRMLKELRNLTPWQWDKKGAQAGAKGLQDFEKLDRVLHGNDSSKTRREPGKEGPASGLSRDSPTTAEHQTPGTPFTVTTGQPRSAGQLPGSRGVKRRAAVNDTPTAVTSPPAGPHSAQPFKAPRTASKTPGHVAVHRPSPASAPVHHAAGRLQRGSSGSIGATSFPHDTPQPLSGALQQGRPTPISVDNTPMPQLRGVLTPGSDLALPAPMQLASAERMPAPVHGDPSPCMATALQLANLTMDSCVKTSQGTSSTGLQGGTSVLPSQPHSAGTMLTEETAPAAAAGLASTSGCSDMVVMVCSAQASAKVVQGPKADAAGVQHMCPPPQHSVVVQPARQHLPDTQQQLQQEQHQVLPTAPSDAVNNAAQRSLTPVPHARSEQAGLQAGSTTEQAPDVSTTGDDDPFSVEAAQSLIDLLSQPPKGPSSTTAAGAQQQVTAGMAQVATTADPAFPVACAGQLAEPTALAPVAAHAAKPASASSCEATTCVTTDTKADMPPGPTATECSPPQSEHAELLSNVSMDVDVQPASALPVAQASSTMQPVGVDAIQEPAAMPAQAPSLAPAPLTAQPATSGSATQAVHPPGLLSGTGMPSFASWQDPTAAVATAQQSGNVPSTVTTAVSFPSAPASDSFGQESAALPGDPSRAVPVATGKPARARRASKERQAAGATASTHVSNNTKTHPGIQKTHGAAVAKPSGSNRARKPQAAAGTEGYAMASGSQGFEGFAAAQQYTVKNIFLDPTYRTTCSDPGSYHNVNASCQHQGSPHAPPGLLQSLMQQQMLTQQPQQMPAMQQQQQQLQACGLSAGSGLMASLWQQQQLQQLPVPSLQPLGISASEPGALTVSTRPAVDSGAHHIPTFQTSMPTASCPMPIAIQGTSPMGAEQRAAAVPPSPVMHDASPGMQTGTANAYQFPRSLLEGGTSVDITGAATSAGIATQNEGASVWGPPGCVFTQAVAKYCSTVGMVPTPANIHQVQSMVSVLRELPMEAAQQMLQQLQMHMAGYPSQTQGAGNSLQAGHRQQAANGGHQSQAITIQSSAAGAADTPLAIRNLAIKPLAIPTATPAVDAEWTTRLDPNITALYSSLLEGHRALRDAALCPRTDNQPNTQSATQQALQQQQQQASHAAAISALMAPPSGPAPVTTGSTPSAIGSKGSTPLAVSTTVGTGYAARTVTGSMPRAGSAPRTATGTAARSIKTAPATIPVPPAIPLSSITPTFGAPLGTVTGVSSTLKALDVNRPRLGLPATSLPTASKALKAQQATGSKGVTLAPQLGAAAGFATRMPASLAALVAANGQQQQQRPSSALSAQTPLEVQPLPGLPLPLSVATPMDVGSFPGFRPMSCSPSSSGNGMQTAGLPHLGSMVYHNYLGGAAGVTAAGSMVASGVTGVTLPQGLGA